jgi:hypothetical protein
MMSVNVLQETEDLMRYRVYRLAAGGRRDMVRPRSWSTNAGMRQAAHYGTPADACARGEHEYYLYA